jgi:hypothetical protein
MAREGKTIPSVANTMVPDPSIPTGVSMANCGVWTAEKAAEPTQGSLNNERGKKKEGTQKKGAKSEESKTLPEGAATGAPQCREAPAPAAVSWLRAMP